MLELNSTNVKDVLFDCLYRQEELVYVDGKAATPEGCIPVKGVLFTFGFHPDRVSTNTSKIKELLSQLPPATTEGQSFLQLCVTRDGVQWGEHRDMDNLMCLGMAAKLVEECVPRELARAMPGGMPYFRVLPEVFNA